MYACHYVTAWPQIITFITPYSGSFPKGKKTKEINFILCNLLNIISKWLLLKIHWSPHEAEKLE